MTERPKVAAEYFARINMTCRVCGALLEAYGEETNDPREPTLHDAAFQCANKMQAHLKEKHGYPNKLFSRGP